MDTAKERVVLVDIEEELKKSYLDYSMSVIVGRALPDVRDGLKPVHRRILYAMFREGLLPNRKYSKCAGVVGEVLKKYHPHGDAAVYESLVRMAQDWNLRYLLIDGQGNFGSIDGDPAAAYRYTEARMTSLAEEMLADIDKDTVDFTMNFDETTEEPHVLPAKVPNLLINGSSGIAVGMATNIPPHNLSEIIDGLNFLIDNPDADVERLMDIIPGPDFPTGGIIYGREEIRNAYVTGKGLIKVRGKAGAETLRGGKDCIVITEIPYTVNKANLIEKIAELVQQKKITGVTDIRDESDKEGIRIVLDLKRGEVPQVILNRLYKHTQMQMTFGAILLALDHGQPKVMNLKGLMQCFIEYRKTVVKRRTQFELRKAEERAHILEGFKKALAHLDAVIKIIREARDREHARNRLISSFDLSDRQVQAILEMRLYQLTGLERGKVEAEYLEVIKRISYLKSLLASEKKIFQVMKDEFSKIRERFGDARRTEIVDQETEMKMEDLIADEACLITISHTGYIKRVPIGTYRRQGRGGRGISGMETGEQDFVAHLFVASTHDYMLFFTHDGRVYWLKVYEIPQGGRLAKGRAIVNILQVSAEAKIAAMLRVRDFSEKRSVVMATRKGIVKKTNLAAFSNPRKGGIVAIKIDEDDALIGATITRGHDEILLATRQGQSIRFNEQDAREMGRVTRGVRGITLGADDAVIGMEIVREEATLLVVTENGYGKRTSFEQYRLQRRGGRGIITIKTSERNGLVVGVKSVRDENDVMVITTSGKMIRIAVREISEIGRNTQGVRIIRLAENDKVGALSSVVVEGAEVEEAGSSNGEGAQERTGSAAEAVSEAAASRGEGEDSDEAEAEPEHDT